jgi:hypothetical protein
MTAHDRGTIGQARNEAVISQEAHPLDIPDFLKVANRRLPFIPEQREHPLLMQQRWETMRQQKAEKSTPVPAGTLVSAATLSLANGEAKQTGVLTAGPSPQAPPGDTVT